MKLLFTIIFLFTYQSYSKPRTTTELKNLAEDELKIETPSLKKSQTVKVKRINIQQDSKKPKSQWAIGYQRLEIKPLKFKVTSVALTTPTINSSQMLYVKAQTAIYKLLNEHFLMLQSSFAYGRSQTQFQSISNEEDGFIEIYKPTVGIGFQVFNYKNLYLSFESGYSVQLYNIKSSDSNFQQTETAQSLQNSITTYWKLFKNSGAELTLSRESLLSGNFNPISSLKLGYRGEF